MIRLLVRRGDRSKTTLDIPPAQRLVEPARARRHPRVRCSGGTDQLGRRPHLRGPCDATAPSTLEQLQDLVSALPLYALTDTGLKALSEWARRLARSVTQERATDPPADLRSRRRRSHPPEHRPSARGDHRHRSASGGRRGQSGRTTHRERSLKLVCGSLRDYVNLHRKLIERVEQELAGAPKRGTASEHSRG